MATSGSTDFTSTRNDIIEGMLRKLGQLAEGETATAQQISDGAKDLERLVKALQARGLHLWKDTELVLFLELTKQNYSLGSTGDRLVEVDDLITTTLSSAAASGASSVDVTSATGVTDGDNIGIVIDDNTIHWTTINGLAGTTATLTDVTDGAAASGNKVYIFTSKASRPLQITHGRVQIDATNETILNVIGREDYFNLSNKSASGVPVEIYYNPTLTNGKLYVWPTVSDERQYLNLTAKMPIEDFDTSGNNPDFPVEWHQPLVWLLAAECYTEYGLTDQTTIMKIEKNADMWLQTLTDFDIEEADIVITPYFGV